jgi:hypothetical protein
VLSSMSRKGRGARDAEYDPSSPQAMG